MAKMNPHDKRHKDNLTMYQKMIEAIYNAAATEAARIASSTNGIDPDTPFRFDDYPQARKRVAELMARLKSRISVTVVNGIDAEWTLANNKNNELANRVFGNNVGRLSQAAYRRYYSTNDNAREAFLARKEGGLSLSQRVWCYAEQFKEEIEMGIDVGLRNGLSADQMSRDLRSYLRHPDKLFRRVRDERGQLHLSRAAAAFHPGQGVYRSSYMNARRLAVTETNMAYRTSDHTRWQQMDFVVGIEIRLSNNHTCKGPDGKPHPFHDICDELAGRYPKDFKFTGWHPHCRCHAVSILKTPKEIAEDTRKILNGEAPDTPSVNEVRDVPPAFRDWVANNADRLEAAAQRGTTPYFIRDNQVRVDNLLGNNQVPAQQFFSPEDEAELINGKFFGGMSVIKMRTILEQRGFSRAEFDEVSRLIDGHRHGGQNQQAYDIEIALAFRNPNSRLGELLRTQAAIEEEAYRIYRKKNPPIMLWRKGGMERDTFSFTRKSGGVVKEIEGEQVEWGADIQMSLDELLKNNRLVAGLLRSDIGYGDEAELFFISKKRKQLTDEYIARYKAEQKQKQLEAQQDKSLEQFNNLKDSFAKMLTNLNQMGVPQSVINALMEDFNNISTGDINALMAFQIKMMNAIANK